MILKIEHELYMVSGSATTTTTTNMEEEGAGTCKIKVNSYQTIHHHITEDSIFRIRI